MKYSKMNKIADMLDRKLLLVPNKTECNPLLEMDAAI